MITNKQIKKINISLFEIRTTIKNKNAREYTEITSEE